MQVFRVHVGLSATKMGAVLRKMPIQTTVAPHGLGMEIRIWMRLIRRAQDQDAIRLSMLCWESSPRRLCEWKKGPCSSKLFMRMVLPKCSFVRGAS